MHVLLSNDDGYLAEGLAQLKSAVTHFKPVTTITVVAPDRNRSGASNSLTLDRPLSPQHIVTDDISTTYAVNGTPTDCVHLGITALMECAPSLVLSGINHGANLGDDVLYSGTVAAATEGRFLGLPAIAVSLACGGEKTLYFESAIWAVDQLLNKLDTLPLKQESVLNVNVPNVPLADIKGIKLTRLGKRHKAKPAVKSSDPQGRDIYWIGAAGEQQDAGDGTDFDAINQGYVSITPLHTDLTDYKQMAAWHEWPL